MATQLHKCPWMALEWWGDAKIGIKILCLLSTILCAISVLVMCTTLQSFAIFERISQAIITIYVFSLLHATGNWRNDYEKHSDVAGCRHTFGEALHQNQQQQQQRQRQISIFTYIHHLHSRVSSEHYCDYYAFLLRFFQVVCFCFFAFFVSRTLLFW